MIVITANILVAYSCLLFFIGIGNVYGQSREQENKICGLWLSTEKNLAVKIFRQEGNFRAKVVWFRNKDNPDKDINDYKDTSNPNPALRNRKILGLEIVDGLSYRKESNSWEKGKIYDPYHGRFWDSAAVITKDGLLKVTGYWKFKWIGKTLTFERVEDETIISKL
ncbi:DUF2147 domain-containing protein [Pseudoxanthomonas sp. SGD-10]|nr:DUF2147 domain-containing protein [Pseudoxanthomonas sp. SGD-10]